MKRPFLPTALFESRRSSALIETTLLSVIFVTALFFLSDTITPRLDAYHDIALFFLAIITLFNGTFLGIVSLFILAGGLYFFTLEYDVNTILSYLLFVLLFGEFHFHFQRQKTSDKEEKLYLKAKFRELSNAFFALKVSHDQLEKGYLLKPVTLRSLIIDLAKNIDHSAINETLFTTFQEAFSLKAALFCELNEETEPLRQIPLGESQFHYDPSHEMIAQCLETKKPVFLAENKLELMEKEPVLAVLPLLGIDNRLLGIYVIEKMDFLEFNMDNILKIQILLEYLEQELFYNKHKRHKSQKMNINRLDARFQFEIDRLHTMHRRFGVHSAVVLVHTNDPAVSLVMENFRMTKMRLLDMVDSFEHKGEYFYIFLLPLERVSGAVSFKQRLERELRTISNRSFNILITEIEKIDTVQKWIRNHEKVS